MKRKREKRIEKTSRRLLFLLVPLSRRVTLQVIDDDGNVDQVECRFGLAQLDNLFYSPTGHSFSLGTEERDCSVKSFHCT